ncbi:MAG: TonB-dependent receptor plug domain-containing protein [Gemmatimonadaceae bacterium]
MIVRDSAHALSPMAMYGFADRRRLGLGAFLGLEELAKHHHETLAALLSTVRGVRVEWGARGQPTLFLRGTSEGSCRPTYFIDGALFELPWAISRRPDPLGDLGAIAPPWTIKGIEVYSNPGAMPAQFDYSSSTGCGSIVIWTR